MNIHKNRKLITLLLLMIFISACSAPKAVLQVTETPAVSLPTSTISPPLSPSIHLEPCQLGSTQAQCGILKVYENREARSGRMIDLRVAVIKAVSDNPACQASFPNIKAEFADLLARLAAQPVTETFTDPSSSQPASVTFTSDFFAAVVRHMTKDTKDDSALPLLIQRAYQENNWQGITQFYANGGGPEWWGDLIMAHVIRCSEKWAAFDPEAVSQLSEGSYLKGWDVSLAQNQAVSCQYTPRGETPEGTAPEPGSQAPVLILNGDMDPIDPPDNMAGAKALWPNSLALVLPYQSHSISDLNAIKCMWSIENEFIQSGFVEGLHTDCLQNIQPAGFITVY